MSEELCPLFEEWRWQAEMRREAWARRDAEADAEAMRKRWDSQYANSPIYARWCLGPDSNRDSLGTGF
jgi:hypothetical protein